MSRSNPSLTNPAQHFFEWSGGRGELEFYDKEKEKRITVPLPFEFLVLDELSTITGFSEQDASRYWSNEIRNIKKDTLEVKTKRGTKEVGLYDNLAYVRSKGARYTKSVYIAHKTKAGDYIMGNLKASGAALTAWIELTKQHAVQNGKVIITGSEQAKKGTTVYHVPTFAYESSSADEDSAAIRLDKDLQIYLSQYLSARDHDERVDGSLADEPIDELATPEEQADFERRKAAKGITHDSLKDEDTQSLYNSIAEGEPVDDSDIFSN